MRNFDYNQGFRTPTPLMEAKFRPQRCVQAPKVQHQVHFLTSHAHFNAAYILWMRNFDYSISLLHSPLLFLLPAANDCSSKIVCCISFLTFVKYVLHCGKIRFDQIQIFSSFRQRRQIIVVLDNDRPLKFTFQNGLSRFQEA